MLILANFAIAGAIGFGLQLFSAAVAPRQEIGKLDNRGLPNAEYNARIPRGRGVFLVRGILIHIQNELDEKVNNVGKIGGKARQFTYCASMQYALSKGPKQGIACLWLNGDVYWDLLSDDPAVQTQAAQNQGNVIFRRGNQVQAPVAALEAISPFGAVPAYRGLCYIVFPRWDLTEELGNRPPHVQAILYERGVTNTQNIQNTILTSFAFESGGTQDPSNQCLPTKSCVNDNVNTALSQTWTPGDCPRLCLNISDPGLSRISVTGTNVSISITSNTANIVNGGAVGGTITAPNCGFVEIKVNTNGTIQAWIDGNFIGSVAVPAGGTYRWQFTKSTNDNTSAICGIGSAIAGSLPASALQIEPIPLAEILREICEMPEVGKTCDVSEINDVVTGVEFSGDSPQEWIAQLQTLYGFLAVDRGDNVLFLNGERPLTAYREFDDLSEFNCTSRRPWDMQQAHALELPYECEVSYYDLETKQQRTTYFRYDYEDPADRPVTSSVLKIDSGGTFTKDEADGIARMQLIRAWNERERFTLETHVGHYDLEPGDVIVDVNGEMFDIPNFRLLITEVNYGANFCCELICVRYDPCAWRAKQTPVFDPVDMPNIMVNQEAFGFVTVDKGRLQPGGGNNSLYAGYTCADPNYTTVDIMASVDGGSSYNSICTSPQSVVGWAGPMAAFGGAGIDTFNTICVKVCGTLNTITDATFNANQFINLVVVGDEVIQFRDAVAMGPALNGFTVYQLSHLRRGVNGTPQVAQTGWTQFALASSLCRVGPATIGAPGTDVLIDATFDGRESALDPCPITLA